MQADQSVNPPNISIKYMSGYSPRSKLAIQILDHSLTARRGTCSGMESCTYFFRSGVFSVLGIPGLVIVKHEAVYLSTHSRSRLANLTNASVIFVKEFWSSSFMSLRCSTKSPPCDVCACVYVGVQGCTHACLCVRASEMIEKRSD